MLGGMPGSPEPQTIGNKMGRDGQLQLGISPSDEPLQRSPSVQVLTACSQRCTLHGSRFHEVSRPLRLHHAAQLMLYQTVQSSRHQ
jgi:hypothetical protein